MKTLEYKYYYDGDSDRVLKCENSDGYICLHEYDNNGNLLKTTEDSVVTLVCEYDDKNRCILEKDYDVVDGELIIITKFSYFDNGYSAVEIDDHKRIKTFFLLDKNENTIYYKSIYYDVESNTSKIAEELYYFYNAQNLIISSRNGTGEEMTRYNYDNKNNLISFVYNSNGYFIFNYYAYDEKNRETSYISDGKTICIKKYDNNCTTVIYPSDNSIHTTEYNDEGNEIHSVRKEKDGKIAEESWTEYDSNGNKIHYKYIFGNTTTENWYEYDDKNRLIFEKESIEHEGENDNENCT